MPRRSACRLLAAIAIATALPGVAAAQGGRLGPPRPFSWRWLTGRAQRLASAPYKAPPVSTNAAADYDAAVRLTYGEAETVAGSLRLFPTSRGVAEHEVGIHVVENGSARAITDTAGLFVGQRSADPAGFRIMDSSGKTDWLAFLGASYFRAAGSRGQYGLSARAIAIDTGLTTPEEFPAFTDFWVERIAPEHFLIHALLDGPSVTGAFAFDSRLGADGVVQDVKAVLFFRKDVARLGIAPATSMFWYDQSSRTIKDDWRPEIHDSDGLAIQSGTGERIWRPLDNPQRARVTSFRADRVKGFGLLQRDQEFAHYQDDSAFYDRRPNLWVEPAGDWGPGAVMLYEMPTASETSDNIAAFWTGDRPARAGDRRELQYRLRWALSDPTRGGVARTVDHFEGPAGIPGAPPIAGARKYVFDFEGEILAGLDRTSGVEAVTSVTAPALLALSAYPVVDQPNRWRAMLDVRAESHDAPEFRLFLRRGDQALTETVINPLSP